MKFILTAVLVYFAYRIFFQRPGIQQPPPSANYYDPPPRSKATTDDDFVDYEEID